METERPHRSNSNNSSSTSELFVCFTSRLSSSSMKLSSKSLLSPSRTSRDPPPQISLSTSLSRRLRSNGSIKGGGQASPMFPATATVGGKRRGCGFENPEPSSPKVTCIGQVRVKTKKQGKKMRVTRSKSKRRTTSEASFRRTSSTEGGGQLTNSSDLTRQNSSSSATYMKQQHRNNQKWVHLPLTICEAFRELNCFFPCRSSCMRDKGDKGHHHHHHHHHHDGGREGSSCGAAFARWLHLALQEGKEREIEVVMREEENVVEDYDNDDDDDVGFGGRSHRRHVFEDIDIDVAEGNKKKEEKEGGEEEEEKGRVSICIPPKNALLLMRCRSDPVKMAALANRFWDSPVHKDQHQHQHQDDEEEDEEEEEEDEEEEEEENNAVDDDVDKQEQVVEMEEGEEVVMQTEEEEERNSNSERETEAGFVNIEEHNEASSLMEKPEQEAAVQESYEIECRTNAEFSEEAGEDNNQLMEEEEEEEKEAEATEEIEIEREQVKQEEEEENDNEDENFSCVSTVETRSDLDKPEESSVQEEEKQENDESSELYSIAETLTVTQQNDEAEPKTTTMPQPFTEEEEQLQNAVAETPPKVTPMNEETELNNELGSEERETGSNGEEREAEIERKKEETLPECLLLMMCEPKLSMEVSKETWVCSTDFIRWLPERPAGKNSGAGRKVHAAVEARNSVEKKPNGTAALPPVQPGRSSCSFPAAPGLSMAAMIEQRLAAGPKSNGGYEPFVLTRCKSEPMRTTAKLAADACFWKKPHAPPPTLGVGAPAGVGF